MQESYIAIHNTRITILPRNIRARRMTRVLHGWPLTRCAATYQYDAVLKERASVLLTRQDTINAMEEILCDEYAMEFAFEGVRFTDLCRMARHRNAAQAGEGSRWLADKLSFKNPTRNLADERNWYLEFK